MDFYTIVAVLLIAVCLWSVFSRSADGQRKKKDDHNDKEQSGPISSKKEETKTERLTRRHEKIGINEKRGDDNQSVNNDEEDGEDGEDDVEEREMVKGKKQESEGKSSHGMTVMSLLGPPGVGKSALSRHITPDFDIVHVSTGELIRAEIAAKSDIGNQVAAIVSQGELVKDEIVAELIEKKFNELKASPQAAGILLDGFPRRISQAQLLDSGKFDIPHLAAVISVTMPDEILALRRSGRRLCPKCGATYNLHEIDQDGYHLKARLPTEDGKCSNDGADLVARPDDDPKIADDRTRVYHEETPAMLDYYRKQGVLIEVEKKRQMKHIYKEIKPELKKLVARAKKE